MNGPITLPVAFADDTTLYAGNLNADFQTLLNAVNALIAAQTSGGTSGYPTNLNYGTFLGAAPATSPSANDTAMTQAFVALQALNGGVGGGQLTFPAGSYSIDPGTSGSGFTVPPQVTLQGIGVSANNSQSSIMFAITKDGTLFYCSGPHTNGGTYFKNLAIGFAVTPSATSSTGIYANYQNTQVIESVFQNTPTAVNLQGLTCGVVRCTFFYLRGPNNAQQLIIAGNENFVQGPGEAKCQTVGNGGPTGCSFISLQGSEHATIMNQHVFYWGYGIDYNQAQSSPNRFTHVSHMEIEAYTTCVRMKPANSNNIIFGEKYVECTFTKSNESTDGSPVIEIDTNGGSATNVNDIEFTNVTAYPDTETPQANQHVLEIGAASNVRINGGTYSNASSSGGAGIALVGGCEDVSIKGVNLQPEYPQATNPESQQYALLVTGNPVGVVTVDGCDMTGYGSGPVHVSGSPGTNLRITNCPGYNDQDTKVSASIPTTATQTSGAMLGYYGPMMITVTGGTVTSIYVGGNASSPTSGTELPITSGTFIVPAGTYFNIGYSGSPSFVAIGI